MSSANPMKDLGLYLQYIYAEQPVCDYPAAAYQVDLLSDNGQGVEPGPCISVSSYLFVGPLQQHIQIGQRAGSLVLEPMDK